MKSPQFILYKLLQRNPFIAEDLNSIILLALFNIVMVYDKKTSKLTVTNKIPLNY